VSQFAIRAAEAADLPGIVGILNHYIVHSHVTFDTRRFEVAERRAWFDTFGTTGRYRLVVAQDGSRIVGYASSTPIRPKPAYDPSVETTIYLEPAATGRGLGRRLYAQLLDRLADEDVHRAYAGIALPNPGSIALHESLGFRHVGTFDEAGRKFGRYWSIGWWERPFPCPPTSRDSATSDR
jgi:phosphinothricin acetyltransferase